MTIQTSLFITGVKDNNIQGNGEEGVEGGEGGQMNTAIKTLVHIDWFARTSSGILFKELSAIKYEGKNGVSL